MKLLAMATDVDYNQVSLVISSRYRKIVMEALRDGPKTPSEIAGPNDDPQTAHISRALNKLRDEGLVKLLVDEDRTKGRLYGLSDDGRPVADEVASRNGG